MNQDQWTAVDKYFNRMLVGADSSFEAALLANSQAGLPPIDVSPSQGKLLYIIALIQGARRVLEIGTLGGYSTLWLAKALRPDGLLVTLEAETKHAAVAQENFDRAGVNHLVRIVLGNALDTLPRLKEEYAEPFDLVFIDADKPNTWNYFKWALRLSRPGTVIIADNVVRQGEILNPENPDPRVQGMRDFIERLSKEPKVVATGLQTVGAKGYDGFVIARVIG